MSPSGPSSGSGAEFEGRLHDHEGRIRLLEIGDSATQTSLRFIRDALDKQLAINDKLAASRTNTWGYIIGFVGVLIGVITLTITLVRLAHP